MPSKSISTVVKIMEALPEDLQEQVAEYLEEHIRDILDEIKWEQSFKSQESQLIKAAQIAKQEIAQGLAKPLNHDDL